jgi:hypothetical protein
MVAFCAVSGLDPVERALLAQIALGDDDACDVLADHWEQDDPARGALLRVQRARGKAPIDPELRALERALLDRHAERWLAPVVAAGFERRQLVFERGFLRSAPVLASDEAPGALFRLSPVLHRELGRAPCNGRVFDACTLTAAGETDHVILKTVDPAWPGEIYDDDILRPSAVNRAAMRGYALRRDDEPNLALVLAGGVHLSNVLGVRSRSDPDPEPRPAGRRLGIAFATAIAHAACRALEALHDAGGRHGALTPENILLDERGGVHLLDLYPSSKLFDTFMPWSRELMWHIPSERSIDGRSDVFSLALVTCTLIDGVHPLAGHADVFERIVAMRDGRLSPPAHLPAAIDQVLRVALADHPHRYPGASAFGDALADAADRARVPYGSHVIAATLGSLPKTSRSADRDQ